MEVQEDFRECIESRQGHILYPAKEAITVPCVWNYLGKNAHNFEPNLVRNATDMGRKDFHFESSLRLSALQLLNVNKFWVPGWAVR